MNEWDILNYKSNNEIQYKKPGLSYFFKSNELKAVTDWNNSSKSFSCNNILLHPESGCDVFRLTTMNDGTVNPFGVYEFLNREIIRRKIPIIYDDYNLSRMNNSYLIQTKKERFNSKYLIISAGSGSRSILYELGIDIPMMTCLISSIYANNKYSFNENFVKNGLIIKKNTNNIMIGDNSSIGIILNRYNISSYLKYSKLINPNIRKKFFWRESNLSQHKYNKWLFNSIEYRRIISAASRLFNDNIECIQTCTALMDIMPDENPIIDIIDNDHILIATGFSGSGLTIAPAVGIILSEIITGDRSKFNVINKHRHFSISRFLT